MKKRIKIICIFTVVSLVLQTGVLLILNNKVFEGFSDDNSSPVKSRSAAAQTIKKEKDLRKEESKEEDIKVDISSNAKDIRIAKSNKYFAYIENNILNYVDIKNNIKKTIDNIVPTSYRWTSDDNILITAKNRNYMNSSDLYLYDISTNYLKRIQQVKLNDEDSKIEEIVCSPFKDISFIKVQDGNRDKLYKVNIKNELESVETLTRKIDKLAILPHEDKIIYKDSTLPKIFITYSDKKIKFNSDKIIELLGVDEVDRIFCAEKDGDKIANIYIGRMNEDTSKWKRLDVDINVSIDNIMISDDGVYCIDKEKSEIINLENKKETKYKGKVLCINKKNVFCINENKIIIGKL